MPTILTICSAKELEHFERIRQSFESVDKQKQDSNAAAPQTVAEAMEAFNLGSHPSAEQPLTMNGDVSPTPAGSIHGRLKGLKQWPGSLARNASGHSAAGNKGKGKSVAGKKAKGPQGGPGSDSSLENFKATGSVNGSGLARKYGTVDGDDDMEDGVVDDEDEDEDDYIVRTDHLANPMEDVE